MHAICTAVYADAVMQFVTRSHEMKFAYADSVMDTCVKEYVISVDYPVSLCITYVEIMYICAHCVHSVRCNCEYFEISTTICELSTCI